MVAKAMVSLQDTLDAFLTLAFNEDYYLRTNPDAKLYAGGPLKHYLEVGWKKGSDPTPGFSGRSYLRANPDVARSGLNPFVHYLQYGISEGRSGHARSGLANTGARFSSSADLAAKILEIDEGDLKRAFRSIGELAEVLAKLDS